MPQVFPLIIVAGAYLIGSIPFSFLVVKLLAREDIRQHGSGNVGATNVARNFGKLPGIIALFLDVVKGFGAVLFARGIVSASGLRFEPGDIFSAPSFWMGAAALAAVLGHMYPVWLRFKGGKGVATATGAFLALNPAALGGAIIIFAIVVIATRYVSLASILAAASVPPLMRFMTGESLSVLLFSIIIALIIIVRHSGNIARLARGEERKFPR